MDKPDKDIVLIDECPDCGYRDTIYVGQKRLCYRCRKGKRKTDVLMVKQRFLRSTPVLERAEEMRDALELIRDSSTAFDSDIQGPAHLCLFMKTIARKLLTTIKKAEEEVDNAKT